MLPSLDRNWMLGFLLMLARWRPMLQLLITEMSIFVKKSLLWKSIIFERLAPMKKSLSGTMWKRREMVLLWHVSLIMIVRLPKNVLKELALNVVGQDIGDVMVVVSRS